MSETISSEPSSKRKRTNENDNHDAGSDVMRSTIWFEDGSIILQAANTQFRVHKGVLSRNSSFFRDMFTIPQPENEPTIEGCAIVHVADDPEDWRYVLEILYDNVKAYKWTYAVSLPMVAAMLRLGRKYTLDHLREEAIERLREDIPVTLDLWDNMFDKDRKRGRWLNYHIFDLVNVLLESGIQTLLPAAYYACLMRYPLEKILRGITRLDGTLLEVSPEAKISLALGQEALLQEISQSLGWFGGEGLEGCLNPRSCAFARATNLETVIANWKNAIFFRPLGGKAFYNSDSPFCSACAQKIGKKIESSRRRAWESLPGYFRLSKWEDLKDD